MKKLLVLSMFALSACGKEVITTRYSGERQCIADGLMGATNCRTGTGNTPQPTATPGASAGLRFEGDVPSPPPSGYTLNGSVRVSQGTPSTWQTLGQNNQPSVTKVVAATMTLPGQCRAVDVKVVVTGGGSNSGTFYLSSSGSRFRVCQEGDKVSIEYEDNVDSLFNDYKVLVSSTTGQPVIYQWIGQTLFICLD